MHLVYRADRLRHRGSRVSNYLIAFNKFKPNLDTVSFWNLVNVFKAGTHNFCIAFALRINFLSVRIGWGNDFVIGPSGAENPLVIFNNLKLTYIWYYLKIKLLRVRLELTTSALLSLRGDTVYKYGALTDCATGAASLIFQQCGFSNSKSIYVR